jgi:hypothetical protein
MSFHISYLADTARLVEHFESNSDYFLRSNLIVMKSDYPFAVRPKGTASTESCYEFYRAGEVGLVTRA